MSTTIEPRISGPSATAAPGASDQADRSWRRDWRLLIGGAVLVLFVLVALLAPLVATHAPDALHVSQRFEGPSGAHLLGTDALGRDLFSRIVYGLRPSLEAGLAAIALAAVVGTLVGLPAGYFGSWFDSVSTRVLDLLIAWPAVFLALALVLVLGSGEAQVVLAIGLAELPVFARLVRSIAVTNVKSEHVVAARTLGASHRRVMRVHILPYVFVPVVVQLAVAAPQALVAEAGLNYLGLGTQPPRPSLGAMVSEGQHYLSLSAGEVVFPILAIVILVIALTMIADGLQDSLDPHRREVLP